MNLGFRCLTPSVLLCATDDILYCYQFDALVSLTYNAGERGASGTFDLVDSGDLPGAADNISKMIRTTVNGKKVVARGLISRRAEEAAPFRAREEATANK